MDGYVVLHGRQDGVGMQYPVSEIGQLSGFPEGHPLDDLGIFDNCRIRREDTVHVRPYLNVFRFQCGTENTCGVIRSATSKGRRIAGFCGADKSLNHRNFIGFEYWQNRFKNLFCGFFQQRFCLGVFVRCDNEFCSIEHVGIYANLFEIIGDQQG